MGGCSGGGDREVEAVTWWVERRKRCLATITPRHRHSSPHRHASPRLTTVIAVQVLSGDAELPMRTGDGAEGRPPEAGAYGCELPFWQARRESRNGCNGCNGCQRA